MCLNGYLIFPYAFTSVSNFHQLVRKNRPLLSNICLNPASIKRLYCFTSTHSIFWQNNSFHSLHRLFHFPAICWKFFCAQRGRYFWSFAVKFHFLNVYSELFLVVYVASNDLQILYTCVIFTHEELFYAFFCYIWPFRNSYCLHGKVCIHMLTIPRRTYSSMASQKFFKNKISGLNPSSWNPSSLVHISCFSAFLQLSKQFTEYASTFCSLHCIHRNKNFRKTTTAFAIII